MFLPELLDFLLSLYVVLAILEKLRAEKHSYLPLAIYGTLCQSLLGKVLVWTFLEKNISNIWKISMLFSITLLFPREWTDTYTFQPTILCFYVI